MKIKTKTSLVILLISIVLACTLSIAHLIFDILQQQTYIRYATLTINDFTQWNNNVSNKALTPFSKLYVKYITDKLSHTIADYISKNKINEHALLKNKHIREILLASTYMDNYQPGYAAIISQHNKIYVSSTEADENKNITEWIEKYPELKNLSDKIDTNNHVSGYYSYYYNNKRYYEFMAGCMIPGTNLAIVYTIALDKYLAPLNQSIERKRAVKKTNIISTIHSLFRNEIIFTTVFSIIILILVYLLSIPLTLWFANSITTPIRRLRNKVSGLGKGNFNISLKESGSEEIKDLINTFNYLGRELKEYTENLTQEVKLREKIETEIEIARKIQETTLPVIDAEFIKSEFRLAARLVPASKVAGDFYDFFYTEDKLVIIIADVSGKGISAAFFMAMTKTLLHNLCLQYTEPDTILQKANKMLSKNNKTCMFATVFLAFYNLKTGEMKYSNAGHEPLLSVDVNNNITELGDHQRTPVGFLCDNADYIVESKQLELNEMLVFYTDGLTDAKSPDGLLFGELKFREIIIKNKNLDTDVLCDTIIEEINRFEAGSFYDDKTLIIFKRII